MDQGDDATAPAASAEDTASRLAARIAERAQGLGLNPRTAKAYIRWAQRLIVWAAGRSVRSLDGRDVEAFLQRQQRLLRELQDHLLRLRAVPLATLAGRLHRTVRVTALVAPQTRAPLTNTARAQASTPDPVPADNEASATVAK